MLIIFGLCIGCAILSAGAVHAESDQVVEFTFNYDSLDYTVNKTLSEGSFDYSIDLPFDAVGTSFTSISIKSTPPGVDTTASEITITKIDPNEGRYRDGFSDFTAQYYSETGEIDLLVDIDGESYIFHLFEPEFNGIIVEPNKIVGEWRSSYVSFDESNNADNPEIVQVLLGTQSIKIKLPDTANNEMKHISIITTSAITYDEFGDYYTLQIDNSASYNTDLSIATKSGEATEEISKYLQIQLIGVSAKSEGVDDEPYKTYATYTPHPDYIINDPHLLVNYSWMQFDPWVTKTLYYKVFDLTVNENLDPIRTLVCEVNETDFSENSPNSISAFIISGDLNMDGTTFGGVGYGKGTGWNELLPNFKWPEEDK